MSRTLVKPVRKGADAQLVGVPEDLGEETVVLVVLGVEHDGGPGGRERFEAGDVVLLGKGEGYGVYRAERGCFVLREGAGHGTALVSGDVVGILKKFKG